MSHEEGFYKRLLESLPDGVYLVDPERRITFWNRGAERISGFSAAEVLGRRCMDNILQHTDDQGRQLCWDGCPLAAVIEDGISRETEIYLRHKEGHRVPVIVRAEPLLDAEGRIVGAVETFADSTSVRAIRDRTTELEALALLDPLTGSGNRGFIEARLLAALDAFQRYGWRCGVLLLDIDHFKQANDTHGHLVGDRILRMVARTLDGGLRTVDSFGRWGGEEFLAVVTNTTALQLRNAAMRLRGLVEQSSMEQEGTMLRVTVSVGGATVRKGDTVGALISRADRLLYRAKTLGRNRVEIEEEQSGI